MNQIIPSHNVWYIGSKQYILLYVCSFFVTSQEGQHFILPDISDTSWVSLLFSMWVPHYFKDLSMCTMVDTIQ